MKKVIFTILLLALYLSIFSQTDIGIYLKVGNSDICNNNIPKLKPSFFIAPELMVESNFGNNVFICSRLSYETNHAISKTNFSGNPSGDIETSLTLKYFTVSFANKFNILNKNIYLLPGFYLGNLIYAQKHDYGTIYEDTLVYQLDNHCDIKDDFNDDVGLFFGVEHNFMVNKWLSFPVGIKYSHGIKDIYKGEAKYFNTKFTGYLGLVCLICNKNE